MNKFLSKLFVLDADEIESYRHDKTFFHFIFAHKRFLVTESGLVRPDFVIYLQAFKVAQFIAVLFSVIFFLLYTFDVFPNLKTALRTCNRVTSAIMLYAIFPFCLIKFFYNINPKKVDVLEFNDSFNPDPSKRNRVLVFFLSLIMSALGYFFVAYTQMLVTDGAGVRLYYAENIFSATLLFTTMTLLAPLGFHLFFMSMAIALTQFRSYR